MEASNTFAALDVGSRRIGVALANGIARFPHAFTTLEVTENVFDDLVQLVQEQQVAQLVVGLPRNLSGEDTDQTRSVRQFVEDLKVKLPDLPIAWQDEALTSRKAEEELTAKGKPFAKGDIDALAATYILEDYLRDNPVRLTA